MQVQLQFGSVEAGVQVQQPESSCATSSLNHANTVEVAPIATLDQPIPAEYRVLLYEQLLQRLREDNTFSGISRDRDNSAASACPEYHLTLTLSALKKGNAALRASTGPVGLLVGATSLRFHALVQGSNGNKLFDKDFKVSKRGDTDSLNVTEKIAKLLSKKLKKANEHAV